MEGNMGAADAEWSGVIPDALNRTLALIKVSGDHCPAEYANRVG